MWLDAQLTCMQGTRSATYVPSSLSNLYIFLVMYIDWETTKLQLASIYRIVQWCGWKHWLLKWIITWGRRCTWSLPYESILSHGRLWYHRHVGLLEYGILIDCLGDSFIRLAPYQGSVSITRVIHWQLSASRPQLAYPYYKIHEDVESCTYILDKQMVLCSLVVALNWI
jgi:hypothetical protein